MSKNIRQRSGYQPCPKCGSNYRIGDDCNVCGTHAPDIKPVVIENMGEWIPKPKATPVPKRSRQWKMENA
jgi:hypothetical protein